MNPSGWALMIGSWAFVSVTCFYLIVKTMRAPRHTPEGEPCEAP